MTCHSFEPDIYLYSELSESEKAMLNAHLHACPLCRQLFLDIQKTQKQILGLAGTDPEVRNASQLTRKIMEGVLEESKPVTLAEILETFLQARWMRYAFTTVSAVLIIAFGTEYFMPFLNSESKANADIQGSVILNARQMRDVIYIQSEKRQKSSTMGCASPLRATPGYLECLRNKMK